jgi:glycosyl transferase family 1
LPLVVSFCGSDLLGTPEPGVLWRMRSRVSRSVGLVAAWRAQSLVVKSHNLLTALPTPLRSSAEIIPNGVDDKVFAPLTRADARSKLGWSESQPVVLFNAGVNVHNKDRTCAVKNLPLAQAAMSELRQSHPLARLETLSSAPQADVALKMSAADCLLVTSLHEGSPNIVKEAMACNLPVVTVPCGDVEKRLARVQPGCVAPYDAAQLASSIRHVLERSARSNGRDELLRQGLTARAVAQKLGKLYDRLRGETALGARERCPIQAEGSHSTPLPLPRVGWRNRPRGRSRRSSTLVDHRPETEERRVVTCIRPHPPQEEEKYAAH